MDTFTIIDMETIEATGEENWAYGGHETYYCKIPTKFLWMSNEELEAIVEREYKAIEEAVEIINKVPTIPCTSCKYCIKGCPQEIPINRIFEALNFYDKYNNLDSAKWQYKDAVKDKAGAEMCIGCGQCETVCPQHIDIIDHLQRAKEILR
jgi:predicted aldo/keto reductase-like oxidoreductase